MARQTAFKIQRYKTYLQVLDSGYIYFGSDKDASFYANGTGVTFAATWTTAGATGRPFAVNLTTNVSLGSYANAFKANVDLSSVGGATGLMSAACLEITNPTTGIAGTTATLELEMTYGATCGALQKPCFIYANATGTAVTDFDTYGDFIKLGTGMTANTGKMIGAGTSTLRIGTGALSATKRYIPLSTAEASYTTAYPIVSTAVVDALSVTCSTLTATAGRIASFKGTMATPAMADGYGAVEIETTVSGIATGMHAALSSWVNITGSGAIGSNYVCAQNNGIYADAGSNTGSTVIFGMRAQGILTDAPTVFAPFSVNTSNREITALFHMTSNPDVGYLANSGVSGGKVGDVPLFCDADGTQYFVRIYSARG